MPINWAIEEFVKLRDAIDAKGCTVERAIEAINKIGVLEKSCWTCMYMHDFVNRKCITCNNFSNYEVKK